MNLTSAYPISISDHKDYNPELFDATFMASNPAESSHALELYQQRNSMVENFLTEMSSTVTTSNSDNDDTMVTKYNSFEPVLHSPIMFKDLADKFHGMLAQCETVPGLNIV